MKLLFWFLLGLVLAVATGILLSHETGRMVLTYGEWTIQSSFSLFVFTFIVIFFIVYLAVRLISGMVRFPKNLKRWRRQRGHRRSERYLNQGMLAMIEGRWQQAETAFKKGAAYSSLPMLNYIGAARAAQQQGAVKRRDHYLRLAHEYAPDADYAVGLTQAELQLNQQQTEQAYATLQHLDSVKPGSDQIKLMMLDASSELNDWHGALVLLQDLEKKGAMPLQKIRAKQLQVYAGMLRYAGGSGSTSKINEEWNKIPKKLRGELYLIEVYVDERLKSGDTADCEVLLRKTLGRRWDSALARLYGLVKGNAPEKQLTFAEKLLARHGGDAALLLTLGRLCKRMELWGKAKVYLEDSIKADPYPETYYELATLYKKRGDHDNAAKCFQKGLTLATKGSTDGDRTIPPKTDVGKEAPPA